MDVSALVAEMHDTLSTIHSTIASLDTVEHDGKLDELEHRRDLSIQALVDAFSAETASLGQKRRAERDDIAERRRREDEERERRRRLEDEELAARDHQQDQDRDGRLREQTKNLEDEIDDLMDQIEGEAQRMIEDGRKKLAALEERRKVTLSACRTWKC